MTLRAFSGSLPTAALACILLADGVLSVGAIPVAAADAAQNSGVGTPVAAQAWQGAWQWLDQTFDGRLLLTEGRFCAIFGLKDRPSPKQAQPTEAEAAALFRSMSGPFAGRMEVIGEDNGESIIEMLTAVAAQPRNVGGRARRTVRVVGDRMFSEIVRDNGTRTNPAVGRVIEAGQSTYQRLSGAGSSRLAGAWELVSDEWDGQMCTTDTEYRYLVTRKNRPALTAGPNNLSDRDAAILYHALDAQGGSYTVSNAVMTRRPAIARDPRQQGREIPVGFRLDADTLTTRSADQQMVWRRLK